jgi:hypothetical protein
VDLVDSSTQAFWQDKLTLMQSEFGKVFLMKVVGNHLIFPPITFQRIWMTKSRDMAKLLSSAAGGRGG